jgi:hypothetical protein
VGTCETLKLQNMDDDDGCYIQIYFYDKLSSLGPSDMPDSSVKHVRGNKFGAIRRETCMILHGNLTPLLLTVLGTRLIVSGTRPIISGTRPIVACTQPVVVCTRPVVASIDPEFTGFIDLQLG